MCPFFFFSLLVLFIVNKVQIEHCKCINRVSDFYYWMSFIYVSAQHFCWSILKEKKAKHTLLSVLVQLQWLSANRIYWNEPLVKLILIKFFSSRCTALEHIDQLSIAVRLSLIVYFPETNRKFEPLFSQRQWTKHSEFRRPVPTKTHLEFWEISSFNGRIHIASQRNNVNKFTSQSLCHYLMQWLKWPTRTISYDK